MRLAKEATIMSRLQWIIALSSAVVAAAAQASFDTLKVEQVYSNADGTVQFVVLHESAGMNGQNLLMDHTFTTTRNGVTKTFIFPKDLPGGSCGGYICMSSPTAGKRVLLATQGFAALGLVTPDYVIPNGFLATDGATVIYASLPENLFPQARMTFATLPIDGVTALAQGGAMVPNAPTNFAGATASLVALPVTAVEFYRAATDHYFISALQPDIDALDSGRFSGWVRTLLSFKVFPTQAAGGAGANPVCRFYIPPQHGDSHFFSADPVVECANVLAKILTDPNYSGYVYEIPNAFYIALPDKMTGACPMGTVPVYRVWNQRIDSNHRYTTDRSVRDAMVAKNYVAEGYGPDMVIMCAPA